MLLVRRTGYVVLCIFLYNGIYIMTLVTKLVIKGSISGQNRES
jgi:hypothetical protein